VHFDLLKLRFSTLLCYPFLHKIVCMILMFYIIGIGQNVDISSSKQL